MAAAEENQNVPNRLENVEGQMREVTQQIVAVNGRLDAIPETIAATVDHAVPRAITAALDKQRVDQHPILLQQPEQRPKVRTDDFEPIPLYKMTEHIQKYDQSKVGWDIIDHFGYVETKLREWACPPDDFPKHAKVVVYNSLGPKLMSLLGSYEPNGTNCEHLPYQTYVDRLTEILMGTDSRAVHMRQYRECSQRDDENIVSFLHRLQALASKALTGRTGQNIAEHLPAEMFKGDLLPKLANPEVRNA